MGFGVFVLEPDATYYDRPEQRYHFSAKFTDAVRDMVGDWIVYHEPTFVARLRGYFAMARVERIEPHARTAGLCVAHIRRGDFIEFGAGVPFAEVHAHLTGID